MSLGAFRFERNAINAGTVSIPNFRFHALNTEESVRFFRLMPKIGNKVNFAAVIEPTVLKPEVCLWGSAIEA
ncbi:hypothetical protein D3C73_1559500 [compost metagenome]